MDAFYQPGVSPGKKQDIGRYWKDILANIPDAVTVYDPSGQIVYANQLASEDLRYASAEQLMQQSLSDISERYIITDADGKPLQLKDLPSQRALDEHIANEKIVHYRTKDGHDDFWLVAKAFPIINRRHGFKYVVSTYHDITTFRIAELQLRESNRRMVDLLDTLMKLD